MYWPDRPQTVGTDWPNTAGQAEKTMRSEAKNEVLFPSLASRRTGQKSLKEP